MDNDERHQIELQLSPDELDLMANAARAIALQAKVILTTAVQEGDDDPASLAATGQGMLCVTVGSVLHDMEGKRTKEIWAKIMDVVSEMAVPEGEVDQGWYDQIMDAISDDGASIMDLEDRDRMIAVYATTLLQPDMLTMLQQQVTRPPGSSMTPN